MEPSPKPPSPEKLQKARESLFKSFSGKLCPFLSIGGMKPEPTNIVGPLGAAAKPPSGEAVGCQGPNCMMFALTAADDEQNANAGACTMALLPSAIFQCRDVIGGGIQALLRNPKFRTRG